MTSVRPGNLRPQRPQRPLHDPVGLPGAGALLVLLLRDPEEDHGAHAERGELGCLAHDLVDGALGDPVEPGDGRTTPSPGQAKSGITTSSSEQARLAHERAQRVGAAEAPEPGDGEAAHRGKGTSAGLPRGSVELDLERR